MVLRCEARERANRPERAKRPELRGSGESGGEASTPMPDFGAPAPGFGTPGLELKSFK